MPKMPPIEADSCTKPALGRQSPAKWGFPSGESRFKMLSWLEERPSAVVISKQANKSLA
jgi:hypothetical protein